jgi:hypothetical protein
MHCSVLHKQQKIILILINVRERKQVHFVNIPHSDLQIVCATGDSSSLATSVTLIRESRGKFGEFIRQEEQPLIFFISVPQYVNVFGEGAF